MFDFSELTFKELFEVLAQAKKEFDFLTVSQVLTAIAERRASHS